MYWFPTKDLSQRALTQGLETSLFKTPKHKGVFLFPWGKEAQNLKLKAKKKIILSFFFADNGAAVKKKKRIKHRLFSPFTHCFMCEHWAVGCVFVCVVGVGQWWLKTLTQETCTPDEISKGSLAGEAEERNPNHVSAALTVAGTTVSCDHVKWGNGNLQRFPVQSLV